MSKRFTLVALFATSLAVSAPAFADGKGKGPTYTPPAPLPSQAQPVINSTPAPKHHSTYCNPACGSSGPHYSNSGLPTNPRPNCCAHTAAPVITHAPIVHAPAQQAMMIDTSSFTGGVGVGVNDVFVGGGGFFGGSAVRSGFGLRSSGVLAGRTAFTQRRLSGFRGTRSGFRGGRGGGRR